MSLTSQKSLVQPKGVLTLVRTSVAMLLDKEVDLPKAEKTREDVFKALEVLFAEAHVANDYVCKAPNCAGQEKQAAFSKTWKTSMDDKEILHISSKRPTISKKQWSVISKILHCITMFPCKVLMVVPFHQRTPWWLL